MEELMEREREAYGSEAKWWDDYCKKDWIWSMILSNGSLLPSAFCTGTRNLQPVQNVVIPR